jgi:hypothetical protein
MLGPYTFRHAMDASPGKHNGQAEGGRADGRMAGGWYLPGRGGGRMVPTGGADGTYQLLRKLSARNGD